ncbi:MAG: hypothetical protein M5U26_11060 [Planctomycetota bacterium]|nr:hypothetical protein [Planctomycetota bacterium]
MPRLWHYFRFSLRTYLTVVVLAAFTGMGVHYAVELGAAALREEMLNSGYRSLQYYFDEHWSQPTPDYPDMVRRWYDSSVAHHPISRDTVEKAMRKARPLLEAEAAAELPRLQEARAKDDVLEFYEVAKSKGNASRYAFLLRNDVVVFSAQKLPDDPRWVEKAGDLPQRLVAEMPQWIGATAVFVSMLIVMLLFGGAILATGFLRWIYALFTYRRPQPQR